jgi:hypothetical protein
LGIVHCKKHTSKRNHKRLSRAEPEAETPLIADVSPLWYNRRGDSVLLGDAGLLNTLDVETAHA